MNNEITYIVLAILIVALSAALIRGKKKNAERVHTICTPYSISDRIKELRVIKQDIEEYADLKKKVLYLQENRKALPAINKNIEAIERSLGIVSRSVDPATIFEQRKIIEGILVWLTKQDAISNLCYYMPSFNIEALRGQINSEVNQRALDISGMILNRYRSREVMLATPPRRNAVSCIIHVLKLTLLESL